MFVIHRVSRSVFLSLILFLQLMIISDQLYAATVSTQTSPQFKLLVVGDSLSAGYGLEQQQGWVTLLQNLWRSNDAKIDIINAAISGDTTDGGLSRLPRLLEQHNPTHVLIELGGNDGLQGHPVDKTRKNLVEMISLAQDAGAVVFLQDMEIPTNYGKRYAQMFSNTFNDIAKQEAITLIPFFLQNVALNPDLMQRDGIHPNAEAQPLIAEYMKNKLTPLILKN